MPAKKTRQADKAVYLLSANHKVRRVSLKKISDRVKKARRPRRVRVVEKVSAGEPSSPVHRQIASAKVASVSVVAAGLFLFAMLVGASWSSSPARNSETAVASADTRADTPVVLAADVASEPVIRATPPIEPRVAKAPPKALPLPAAMPPKPASSSAPSSAPASVEAPSAATAASADTVTISGCLDLDGKSAWLKDTSGIDAPKARSWRSGFLKKSTPRIALVAGPINQAYDGRRVSVTGVMVDREMHVSSLKPIANNCD